MDKYCSNCGAKLEEGADVCLKCGKILNEKKQKPTGSRSKVVAGLLGLFFGVWGVHNFYLGKNDKALTQLLLTLFGWILLFIPNAVVAIWTFVESIMILTGSIDKDGEGKPLID